MKKIMKPLVAALVLFVAGSPFLRAQTNLASTVSNSVAAAAVPTNTAPAPVASAPVDTPNPPVFHADAKDVVGIFAVFGTPVLIVALALLFKYRRDRLTHETLRALLEKGVPITPELVAQLGGKHPDAFKPSNNARHLLPGLVMVGVGLALLISSHAGIGAFPHFPGGGWIILFVGAAFLIVWWVERKSKNDAQPPKA
jgi:hypothetical protein